MIYHSGGPAQGPAGGFGPSQRAHFAVIMAKRTFFCPHETSSSTSNVQMSCSKLQWLSGVLRRKKNGVRWARPECGFPDAKGWWRESSATVVLCIHHSFCCTTEASESVCFPKLVPRAHGKGYGLMVVVPSKTPRSCR
jgi:hypothetical protein